MPIASLTTNKDELKVQVSLRLPVRYRDQIAAEAHARGLSINSLIVEALEVAVPPA